MLTETHPWRPNPELRLHRGINFSNLDVPANTAGSIFTVGSVLAVLFGLPFLIPYYAAALVGGVGLAVLLNAWNRRHES